MQTTPITFSPIGYIRSEHIEPPKVPVQPAYARGCAGRAEILPEYAEGLKDIEEFSHIFILFHLHRAKPAQLVVTPFMEDIPHGVFATRAPMRPNPIGFSLVRLLRREDNVLVLDEVDILDMTPILDIKPYIHRFDSRDPAQVKSGWQDRINEDVARVRGRRGYTGPEK